MAARTGSSMVFCFNSVTYIPQHGALGAMAAACRCPSRHQLHFPPVYPFPTPGPACAVIVGVSLRSPPPQSAWLQHGFACV